MKRLLLVLTLFAATAALGTTVGRRLNRQPPEKPAAPPPVLVVEEARLNFGEVWESDRFVWSVPVRNATNRPVRVKHVTGSCPCMDIRPKSFELAAGAEQAVSVTIDLTAKQRPGTQAMLLLTAVIATEDGGEKPLPPWQLTGTSRPLFQLAGRIYTGRQSMLAQPLQDYVVPFRTGTAIPHVRVETTEGSYKASVQTDPADATKHELRIAFQPELPVGPMQGEVRLFADQAPPGTVYPMKRVELMGDIVRDVESLPDVVAAGGQEVGRWFERSVALSSLTGRPFTVQSAKANDSNTVVEASAGEYRVRHRCSTAGPGGTSITFVVRAADGEYPIRVPVEYVGVAEADSATDRSEGHRP